MATHPICRTAALALLLTLALAATAQAAYPGHNGRIAFERFDPLIGDFDLYTANPDGSHVIQITHTPNFSNQWSADGRHIAYDIIEPTGDEQIATVDPDGSHTRQLTRGPGLREFPAYSPDGSAIIYDYSPLRPDEPGFHTTLWTMNADGSDQRPLPGSSQSADAFDVEARYSPDGRYIAFVRIRFDDAGNQQNALFVMRAARGRAGWSAGTRQLTDWQESVETPDWSPDGRWLTYYNHADDGGVRSVLVIRRDGTHEHVVYQGQPAAEGARPVFSPDGSKILFTCITWVPSLDADLCTIDPDGSHLVDITNTRGPLDGPSRETRPTWGTAPVLR